MDVNGNDQKGNYKLVSKSTFHVILMTLGVIFIAMNLRAPLTSVGPVIAEISAHLNLSNLLAGLLTTIPLLAFAGLSTFAPRFARKYGIEFIILFSIIVLIIGLIIRSLGNVSFLFLGAALIGLAITIGNVIIPAFIKKHFPDKIGLMNGLYSVFINLSAALAAGFSITIGLITGMGWQASIGIWFLLGIPTFIIWLALFKLNKNNKQEAIPTAGQKSIWKSYLAWQIALFMGFQSFIFYSIITWLPVILQHWGMSAHKSGWMLSYIQLTQLPIAFMAPIIAGRMKNQTLLVWITFIFMISAFAGLIFGKTLFILPSAILLGIAMGIAFSLCIMFFSLRTKNAFEAASLSGMSQSIGYLLAASGPPIFGALFDWSGIWLWSLILLVFISIALLITGLASAKDRFIS